MRSFFFLAIVLGVLSVYFVACGAASVSLGAEGAARIVLDRMAAPWQTLSPLGISALSAGIVCFGVAAAARSNAAAHGPARCDVSWPSVLHVVFFVNGAVLAAITAHLLLGSGGLLPERQVGILVAAGLYSLGLGAVLALTLLFVRRPPPVFLPALAVFLTGSAGLAALVWAGSTAFPS